MAKTSTKEASRLLEKIGLIYTAVGSLEKDREVKGGLKYQYLSESKITSTVRQKLRDLKLVFYGPVETEIIEVAQYKNTSGKMMNYARIKNKYCLIDAETGESLHAFAYGEGMDIGDKAFNKAMTGAYKYALRGMFMITDGKNDPDEYHSEYLCNDVNKNTQPEPKKKRSFKESDARTTMERRKKAEERGAFNGSKIGDFVTEKQLEMLGVYISEIENGLDIATAAMVEITNNNITDLQFAKDLTAREADIILQRLEAILNE